MFERFTVAWFNPARLFCRAMTVPRGPAVFSALEAAVQLYLQWPCTAVKWPPGCTVVRQNRRWRL